jgi:hypothetical protein
MMSYDDVMKQIKTEDQTKLSEKHVNKQSSLKTQPPKQKVPPVKKVSAKAENTGLRGTNDLNSDEPLVQEQVQQSSEVNEPKTEEKPKPKRAFGFAYTGLGELVFWNRSSQKYELKSDLVTSTSSKVPAILWDSVKQDLISRYHVKTNISRTLTNRYLTYFLLLRDLDDVEQRQTLIDLFDNNVHVIQTLIDGYDHARSMTKSDHELLVSLNNSINNVNSNVNVVKNNQSIIFSRLTSLLYGLRRGISWLLSERLGWNNGFPKTKEDLNGAIASDKILSIQDSLDLGAADEMKRTSTKRMSNMRKKNK